MRGGRRSRVSLALRTERFAARATATERGQHGGSHRDETKPAARAKTNGNARCPGRTPPPGIRLCATPPRPPLQGRAGI